MKVIQKLAGQTAIYGLPSIVGRLLNYLLVPLHTGIFIPERFGVITEMYSYVAFLVVFLTYGMETAYFRFQSKAGSNSNQVFSTVSISLFFSTAIFISLTSVFSQSIADFIRYPENQEYVVWFAFIVGLDAISSIPLARLRVQNKAKRFAAVNMISIFINIGLNYFWIGYCMGDYVSDSPSWFTQNFYSPGIGIGYVFLANLLASIVKFLLLSPAFFRLKLELSLSLLKEMIWYASPLLLASLAIIVNESADKIMLKWMLLSELGPEGATEQVGIYGACYKLSIIITLFIQAFRYAAEPFFFAQEREKNSRAVYAKIMKYFVIVCSIIFLGVTLYIDILKYFIPNEAYWVGLKVVPILLFANIFLGIFYNLSVWYKLSGKTGYGALIAGIGALITIALNLILIPKMQYMGSAWATLVCYFCMVVLSYSIGKKHFPVPYPVKRISIYLLASLACFAISEVLVDGLDLPLKLMINSLILLAFAGSIYVLEKPKKGIIS